MKCSESISELAKALCAAQAAMRPAAKASSNAHFGNSYADLADVWASVRKPLTDNGLAVIQAADADDPEAIRLETMLVHGASGEWISTVLTLRPAKIDPQSIGSVVTYARRYSLACVVGAVSDDDDDGTAASQRAAGRTSQTGASTGSTSGRRSASSRSSASRPADPETVATLATAVEDGDHWTAFMLSETENYLGAFGRLPTSEGKRRAKELVERGGQMILEYVDRLTAAATGDNPGIVIGIWDELPDAGKTATWRAITPDVQTAIRSARQGRLQDAPEATE